MYVYIYIYIHIPTRIHLPVLGELLPLPGLLRGLDDGEALLLLLSLSLLLLLVVVVVVV